MNNNVAILKKGHDTTKRIPSRKSWHEDFGRAKMETVEQQLAGRQPDRFRPALDTRPSSTSARFTPKSARDTGGRTWPPVRRGHARDGGGQQAISRDRGDGAGRSAARCSREPWRPAASARGGSYLWRYPGRGGDAPAIKLLNLMNILSNSVYVALHYPALNDFFCGLLACIAGTD